MSIKTFKPTTPSRRQMTVSGFDGIDKKAKPEPSLTEPLKKSSGRNSYGRITVRHRGGGNKRKYRIIDFKRDKIGSATVLRLEYDPNRSAHIALIQHEDIYQLSAFLPPEKEAEFLRRCPGCLAVRWEDDFCDILPEGGGKPNGLAHTLAHLGLTREQSIAFGDGGNDVAMLRAAGAGVAMGNACDEALAAADYVTASVDDDGIRRALEHFGVI